MRSVLILLALGSVIHGADDKTIFAEMRDGRVSIQTKILPASTFTVPNMETVGRQFLGDLSTSLAIARLSLYDREDVAVAETAGMCEGSYLQWRLYFDRFPKRAFAAADVISIRENAVLRMRTASGLVTQWVLRGSDPTRVLVDGVSFEMLFVAGRTRSRFEDCGAPGTVEPVLFLRTTSALDLDLCRRATLKLAAVLGVDNIWTEF